MKNWRIFNPTGASRSALGFWLLITLLPGLLVTGCQLTATEPKNAGEQKGSTTNLLGKTFPGSFQMPLLDGGSITLPKPNTTNILLIEFCATWCPWCQKTMPAIDKIAKDYTMRGVEVVEVSVWNEKPDNIRRYLARANLNLTVALDQTNQMLNAFHISGVPTIVIVDHKNVIQFLQAGYDKELEDMIRNELDLLLQPASSRTNDKASPEAGPRPPTSASSKRNIQESRAIVPAQTDSYDATPERPALPLQH